MGLLSSNPFYTLSWKTTKIYLVTYGIPLGLALCWVLLPLGEEGEDPDLVYAKFSGFSSIMWFIGHLAWLTFYDCIIPGCSKLLLVITTILFLVSCAIFLWLVSHFGGRQEKFVYVTPQLLSFFWCQVSYTIHILSIRHKVSKTSELSEAPIYGTSPNEQALGDLNRMSGQSGSDRSNSFYNNNNNIIPTNSSFGSTQNNPNDILNPLSVPMGIGGGGSNAGPQQNVFNPLYDEEVTSPRMREITTSNGVGLSSRKGGGASGSSGGITNRPKLNLDQYMAEQFPEQKPATTVIRPGENGEEHRWSEYVSYYLCFMKSVDTKKPPRKKEWVPLFSLAMVAIYRGIIELTFIWLLIFSNLFIQKNILQSPIQAFLSILLFQGSRIFITRTLLVINELLPKSEETQYFTFFAVQALYFLLYRSLFVQASYWVSVVSISVGTFLFSLCYTAAHMMHAMYYFRYFKLPEVLECLPPIKLAYITFLGGEVTYEKHTGDLIIEYYYEELSEYFSVIVFFIFIPTLRNYNSGWYPSLNGEQLNYRRLMFQYLYLFLFECLSDASLRLIVKRSLAINITHEARERTIRSYRTRFLFSLFILYILCFTYLSLMDISTHLSTDPRIIEVTNSTNPFFD